MRIDGYTRMAAVVAQPIKHSISPFIHNWAFERLGINGVYLAWEIGPKDLAETVANVRRYDMYGLNLSMPYKQAVMPYLDDLTEAAQLIGAVNTVIHQEGRLIGHNTDGIGFWRSLEQSVGRSAYQARLTVLGAGGAALAIVAQAASLGCQKICVFNRQSSLDKRWPQLDKIRQATGVKLELLPLEDEAQLSACLRESDVLINTTSLGMDGYRLPFSERLVLPPHLVVADVIYQPWETPLLKKARGQGLVAVNGLGMLLFQAAAAFEAWTGQVMPVDELAQVLAQRYHEEEER